MFGAASRPLALGPQLTPRPSPTPRATARLGPDAALAAPTPTTPSTAASPTPSTATPHATPLNTPPTRP